jgi:hypothetical protein
MNGMTTLIAHSVAGIELCYDRFATKLLLLALNEYELEHTGTVRAMCFKRDPLRSLHRIWHGVVAHRLYRQHQGLLDEMRAFYRRGIENDVAGTIDQWAPGMKLPLAPIDRIRKEHGRVLQKWERAVAQSYARSGARLQKCMIRCFHGRVAKDAYGYPLKPLVLHVLETFDKPIHSRS